MVDNCSLDVSLSIQCYPYGASYPRGLYLSKLILGKDSLW